MASITITEAKIPEKSSDFQNIGSFDIADDSILRIRQPAAATRKLIAGTGYRNSYKLLIGKGIRQFENHFGGAANLARRHRHAS
ncbi:MULTISPECIES: hypothetical protein [Sphingobium]|uniref:hypothetical protein n=1 Tax=Sphingobium TaxID=165695 RepID=UPI00159C410A|nr:hypothetical protein [Sphingobium sp. 15-1]